MGPSGGVAIHGAPTARRNMMLNEAKSCAAASCCKPKQAEASPRRESRYFEPLPQPFVDVVLGSEH